MDLTLKYFPDLSDHQKTHFQTLIKLYPEWNARINVISRKDIQHLEERHILHSLSIAKLLHFTPGSEVLDLGTGGGFPGIPLAIMFPHTTFTLVDSIAKKINVVNEICSTLALDNVKVIRSRVEDLNVQCDYVVSRAVAPLQKINAWIRGKIRKGQSGTLPNGLLYLKGGDIAKELKPFGNRASLFPLNTWFSEDFFSSKMIVYIKK